MKTILKNIFFFILCTGTFLGQKLDTTIALTGFRNAEFGMSKEQVKSIETAKRDFRNHEQDNELYYFGEFIKLKCYYGYFFHCDSLVGGQYDFYKIFVDKNKYIDNFNRVTAKLIMDYGEPTLIQQWWRDKTEKDNKDMWGYAVGKHQMQLIAIWQFENGGIESRLYGFNGSITLEVNYYDHKVKVDDDVYWGEVGSKK